MRRLAALALGLWLLAAPALAQNYGVPIKMVDANLTIGINNNFVGTLNAFTAPRTLTLPNPGSVNIFPISFVDTANAVNGANTLTIVSTDGGLVNGAASLVISVPGAYAFIVPSVSGYRIAVINPPGSATSAGGSSGQVQYNNAGVLGGISGATSNGIAITLVAPILGTPASGTLTNTTGFPVANLAGAGAGCLTWIATPSSANLRGCLTDETGTGIAYFVGGALGTPASGVATNLTGTAAGLTAGSFSAGSAANLTSGTLPAARTNGHMNGTATNDNAAAGEVGEIMSADLPSGTPVSLTSSTVTNITTITLTAGDWDVYTTVIYTPAATTSQTRLITSTATTSATIDTTNAFSFNTFSTAAMVTAGQNSQVSSGPRRISTAGSQQVWAVAQAIFTVSTMTAYGSIRARRVR